MHAKSLARELESLGLRRAEPAETGWWYTAWCGLKVYVCKL